MNAHARRAALAAAALVTAATGVLASTGTAQAFEVSYSSWDGGTNVLLTGPETSAAIADGVYFTTGLCGDAITRAALTGISFPDRARAACGSATTVCAQEARAMGNALSGTRLYADGTHRCLVR